MRLMLRLSILKMAELAVAEARDTKSYQVWMTGLDKINSDKRALFRHVQIGLKNVVHSRRVELRATLLSLTVSY